MSLPPELVADNLVRQKNINRAFRMSNDSRP